jgi:hypothetical protein
LSGASGPVPARSYCPAPDENVLLKAGGKKPVIEKRVRWNGRLLPRTVGHSKKEYSSSQLQFMPLQLQW